MQPNFEQCKLHSIPQSILNLDLGKYLGGYSSANAKEPHPFYNIYTAILLIGLILILLGLLCKVAHLNDFVKGFTIFGTLIWIVVGIPFLVKIFSLWKEKNHYIKKIYIFSDGFVWEIYKKEKLIDQKVFRYEGGGCDMLLKANDFYMYGLYVRSNYWLRVDYYDYDKDKWRKFKIFQSERNLNQTPEKTKWLVMSIKLIYDTWLHHRD